MKRCPECRRDYYDETLMYCLDDGAHLLEGPASGDESATAILSEPPVGAPAAASASGVNMSAGGQAPSESATRPQIHTTEAEPRTTVGHTAEKRSFSAHRAAKPLAVLVIALLLLIAGFFGYRYFAPAKQIESIAVMPFVNESGNPDLEYLSDGMAETLIGSLSQIPGLSVKARSSVFRYKGKETDSKTIGKELGVQAILNGRVVQRGDKLTLGLELIDAETENVIWSGKYDRKTSDLVSLQNEIALDVSSKLKTKLSPANEQELAKKYTSDPEAYRLYLQGRFFSNKANSASIKKAIEHYEQSIAIDKNFALAYAGLAESLQMLPWFDQSYADAEWGQRAKAAANKALEIDNGLAEPRVVLANLLLKDWKFEEAEREFKTAIAIDPGYATAHQHYARVLLFIGKHDEAIAETRKALELDPVSLLINTDVGFVYAGARQFDMAIEQLRRTVGMDPGFVWAHYRLGDAYCLKGMAEECANEYEKADILDGKPPEKAKQRYDAIRNAFRTEGIQGFWRKDIEIMLREDPLSLVGIASDYAQLNEKDKAFEILEKQYEKHDPELINIKGNPFLDPLHDDPRYHDLIRRIGFPE